MFFKSITNNILNIVAIAVLSAVIIPLLTVTPYNRVSRSYEDKKNYDSTKYIIIPNQDIYENGLIQVQLDSEANSKRLLEIKEEILFKNKNLPDSIIFYVDAKDLPINYIGQDIQITWAILDKNVFEIPLFEYLSFIRGWHSGHLEYLINKMQKAIDRKDHQINGAWVYENKILFVIRDKESPANWRFEDLHKNGNNYMERLPLKKSRFMDIEGESFTDLKDKIIFQIPVSPPEYGFVTCSLDKCGNLKLANEEKVIPNIINRFQ